MGLSVVAGTKSATYTSEKDYPRRWVGIRVVESPGLVSVPALAVEEASAEGVSPAWTLKLVTRAAIVRIATFIGLFLMSYTRFDCSR